MQTSEFPLDVTVPTSNVPRPSLYLLCDLLVTAISFEITYACLESFFVKIQFGARFDVLPKNNIATATSLVPTLKTALYSFQSSFLMLPLL